MKKIISLILIFALMLTSTGSLGYAKEVKSDFDAISILRDIGVMDKDLSGKTYVTRADFVRMAVNIAKGKNSLEKYGTTAFWDVGASSEDFYHINYAAAYKMVSGDELGNFNPDRTITYAEASKILITMLGYDPLAKVKGGWPAGYLYMVSDLKLNRGVNVVSDMLTPTDCASFILNALECETMDISSIEGDSMGFATTGKTLMYSMMNIAAYEGVLTENSYAGINISNGVGSYFVKIGNLEASSYTTDAEKYIGCRVKAYYSVDGGAKAVLSLYPLPDNRIWIISADEFSSFVPGEMKYHDSERDRTEILRLERNMTVICNGKVKDDYNEDTFEISSGIIRVIDNDSDGRAELVNVEEYVSFPVAHTDTDNHILYGRFGESYDVDTSSGDVSAIFYDSLGVEIPFEKIGSEHILSLMASEDGKYIRAIVSDKKINATVNGIRTEGEYKYLTLDSEEYRLSPNIPTDMEEDIKLGINSEFYIDAFSDIAFMTGVSRTEDYGMIIAYSKGTGISNNPMLKLINVNGVIKIYNINNKCKINGTAYSSVSDLESAVSTPNTMIIYKLNDVMEICSIDTVGGGSLKSLGEKAMLSYSGNQRWFSGRLSLNYTTPVFVYPSEGGNDDDYLVANYLYLPEGNVTVQGFTSKEKSYAPEVVAVEAVPSTNRIWYNDLELIVKDITRTNDEFGEVTHKIYAWNFSGSEVWYKLKDSSVIDGLDLKKGDFIKVRRNDQSYIEGIDKFYDADAGELYSGSKYMSVNREDRFTAGFYPYVGYIYERNGDFIGFSKIKGASDVEDVRYYSIKTPNVLIYEENYLGKPSVKVGDKEDLTDYLNNGTETRIFFCSESALIDTIVVFK